MFDPEDEEQQGITIGDYDDTEICGACQESPCMCSDPEQTSTIEDW